MKKKILMILASLFLFSPVWAQNLHFPYIYSNNPEETFNVYEKCTSGEQIIEDFYGDNFIGGYFQTNSIHCFVLRYKSNGEVIETVSTKFLNDYRTLFKMFDKDIDAKKGRNLKLFFVFVGNNNKPIAYALYSENINASENTIWNPLNGVKRSIDRANEATEIDPQVLRKYHYYY